MASVQGNAQDLLHHTWPDDKLAFRWDGRSLTDPGIFAAVIDINSFAIRIGQHVANDSMLWFES